MKKSIKEILAAKPIGQEVTVCGWVRTFRSNQFIAVSDGSCMQTMQVVVDHENTDPALLKRITTGSAVIATGTLIESMGKGQAVEVKARTIEVVGDADPDKYLLQPKKHSMEFLRDIAHMRIRTNTFGAVMRIRHALAYAIHHFFHERGFFYFHSPIITGSDAEGAGEMFKVTTLSLENTQKNKEGDVDFKKDFFGKATNLTVSGQLEAELAALALSRVYTFGPTFRAENSNTTRHLAEFWMIEPEVAFFDLKDNMDLAESMLKYVIAFALEHCADDIQFLKERQEQEESTKPQQERSTMDLITKLHFVVDNEFQRLKYEEAIQILINSTPNKKGKFQYPIEGWGTDLQSEHERYLVEKHFQKPVILTNYPKEIKAFYMRVDDDGRTVSAMDILFPSIGEIVGGSQREERLDVLTQRMEEMHIPLHEMDWYLDTRRFGTCPHAGFGLGFERLVLFVTGMTNIRDVIPFPRTPGNAEF
ncbi:MAG: asparagine--tRNA ligase [Saprospiraceae bacterium]|uniref:Asparagine--tRNA ligase n=1 Tax=Candidatus Opimibacter skivensis TaxID=2982028 RepID=A0A9D7XR46_9BACT|nr:asparagine--tRNA ligase [Candidatus Opimibacter skivensis]